MSFIRDSLQLNPMLRSAAVQGAYHGITALFFSPVGVVGGAIYGASYRIIRELTYTKALDSEIKNQYPSLAKAAAVGAGVIGGAIVASGIGFPITFATALFLSAASHCITEIDKAYNLSESIFEKVSNWK